MSDAKKGDSIATQISDSVIAEAMKSVERRAAGAAAEVEVPVEAQAAAPAEAPAPSEPAAAAEDSGEVATLRQQLLEARQTLRQREAELEASQAMGRETLAKLRDQHERSLRSAADLENFKKRAARERDEVAKFGLEKLLREVLPVLDNLDRALDHAKTPSEFDGLKSGITMTRKLFEDTLAKFGVKSFTGMGQLFDPNRHEAMQSVESDAPAGTVIQELVRGYTLHERLMRPAMVVVARPRQQTAPGVTGSTAAESKAGEDPAGNTSSGGGAPAA